MAPTAHVGSGLLRQVRLVRVGAPVPTVEPVDVRVTDGVVTEVRPGLQPAPGERVWRADGRWVMPGLWDHHVHMASWARARGQLDVSAATRAEDVVGMVADHLAARVLPASTPVFGFGYRSATWPAAPKVPMLDEVAGGVPVVLSSGDGHNGWLSSAALILLGMPERVGAVDERSWFDLQPAVARLAEAATDLDAAMRDVVSAAAARGVVGITDLEMDAAFLRWPHWFAAGADLLRVRAATYPDRLGDVVAAGLRSGDPLAGGAGLLTMGPLKVITDGSLNTRTAWCFEPYACGPAGEPTHGTANYEAAELTAILAEGHAHGLRVAMHAIGDAAFDQALRLLELTGARGTIEHAQLVRPEDLALMARLPVTASVQPAHLPDDRDVAQRCWPGRGDRCFAFHSMLTAGVPLALGSDAPVAPLDPWLAMAAAVHRSGDDRPPWNPAESLTPEEALAASTDGQTTVAPSSRADLVVLDDNPLPPPKHGDAATSEARSSEARSRQAESSAQTAAALRRTQVWGTFVAGCPTLAPS